MAAVQGNRHHDNIDRGAPVKIGGKAKDSAPTAVADGDRVDAYFDAQGRQVVVAVNSAGADLGGGGEGAILDGVSPTIKATVQDLANSNPLNVAITDGSGNQITSFGGGTQYTEGDTDASITGTAVMWEDTSDTLRAASAAKPLPVNVVAGSAAGTEFNEDSAHSSGAAGTLALAVRNDNGATLTSDDLDYSAIAVDNAGQVKITAGGTLNVQFDGTQPVSTDVDHLEDAAHSTGDAGAFVLAVRNDNAATTLTDTDGDYSAIAVTNKGAVHIADGNGSITVDGTVAVSGVSGTVAVTQSGTWDEVGIHDSGNSITVDNGGTFATQVDGAALTALQLIDDPVQVLGTDTYTEATSKGMTIGAVRRDADTTLVNTTNEFGPLQMDANGRLKVEAFSGETLPISGTVTAAGGAAHGSPASGNPNLVAGRASNAIPTDVGADGDAASIWTNRSGAPVVSMAPHVGLDGSPWTLSSKTVQNTTAQTGTDILTPTSGKKLVVTKAIIACGGTTAATVQLWFGANADTTYSRGTDLAIYDGEFAPSATLKPGVVLDGPFIASAADHEVHITTSAGITITVTLWYYEI